MSPFSRWPGITVYKSFLYRLPHPVESTGTEGEHKALRIKTLKQDTKPGIEKTFCRKGRLFINQQPTAIH
nr:MAG TPA: hypothetical protein [Caudoviricetes sp.]DAH28658.1 MAG TPA: hypothetical protein [Caudoviricetes sp.]